MTPLLMLRVFILASLIGLAGAAETPPTPTFSSEDCSFLVETPGVPPHIYNFSALVAENMWVKSVVLPSGSKYDFVFRVCQPVELPSWCTSTRCKKDCVEGSAGCQRGGDVSRGTDFYFSLGKNSDFKFQEIVLSGQESVGGGDGVKLTYGQGTNNRKLEIEIVCTPGAGLGEPTFASTRTDPLGEFIYTFRWATDSGCAKPVVALLSLGSILLIILAVLIFAYVVFGMLIMRFVRKETGFGMIPNVDFWRNLPGLVKDGSFFAFQKVSCKKSGEMANYREL